MKTAALETTGVKYELKREIGQYGDPNQDPWLICIGGIHGNEFAGVAAIQRVFQKLQQAQIPIHGNFIGIAGNLQALSKGQRYLRKDLNRMWVPERIDRLQDGPINGEFKLAEDREQAELFERLERILQPANRRLYFLDLHTTSSHSAPFAIFGDTLRNRRFARHFPVPLILGLEEVLDGVLIEYLTNLGHIAMAFEGGQHEAPESVDRLEAAIWIALMNAGLVRSTDVPRAGQYDRLLAQACKGLPHVSEVVYRHEITPEDHFQMHPGFKNFQKIRKNQRLAIDRNGQIKAPANARILMPLYQGLGNDGFFLVRDVHPLWLKFSSLLRRLRIDKLIPYLPGIRRHPKDANTFIVNTVVARLFTIEVFHLLGYRRKLRVGKLLYVSKRSYDMVSPLEEA